MHSIGRGRAIKPGYQILCQGNSLTAGQGAPAGADYPALLAPLLAPHAFLVRNQGTGAADTLTLIGQSPPYALAPRTTTVAVLWEMTNAIFLGTAPTAVAAVSQLATWAGIYRSLGCKVVSLNCIARGNFTAPQQIIHTQANALWAADWPSWADAGVDVAAIPGLQFDPDGVHLTNYGPIASAVAPSVIALLT